MKPLRPRYSRISREVDNLLQQVGVDSPPVPLDAIAHHLGVPIMHSTFEDDVSGLLIRRGSSAVIGVNSSQAEVRKRFTIAHEIGHLVLHSASEFEEVHVDKGFRVQFRSAVSATAEDVAEIEANAFAAGLLMPEAFLREDIHGVALDLEDAHLVGQLAQRYQVSAQAMTYRLMNLFQTRER